jgi:hypothetical protein
MSQASSSTTIRNCHFRYRCHMEWSDLTRTQEDGIRHCSVCDKNVYLCKTEAELFVAIIENRCVAIPADIVEKHSYESISEKANLRDPGMLMGDIIEPR